MILLGALMVCQATAAHAETESAIAQVVARNIQSMMPKDGVGGAAVAVRMGGRTLFFNYGKADLARDRPVTSDSLFNLGSVAKVFDTALLMQAVLAGEVRLDDPVAKYIPELQKGGDIRRITLGQLASYTSGFALPQDNPPWPLRIYTLDDFIKVLIEWKADAKHQPGRQMIYSHSGFLLLHIALERRFGIPIGELMQQRLLGPLGLDSTALPVPPVDAAFPRGRLAPALVERAVQGYGGDGKPVGAPGNLQGFFRWLGAGQMYASTRDMAAFLAANLDELPGHRTLQMAMRVAQQGIFPLYENVMQALSWEVHQGDIAIVDKNGGLDNATSYIGVVPSEKIGVVILINRGQQNAPKAGRTILRELAQTAESGRH
jgi:beta-lactamase class C